jgi:hypothetical protein
MIRLLAIIPAALLATACATKNYGRQAAVSDFERKTLSCREIDIELAKTQAFIDHVNKESQFSGRDVLAILGDFGIGNNLERSSAMDSANNRLQQLRSLRDGKGCPPSI